MDIGRFHLVTALLSLIVGAFVFLGTRKGTRLHRQAGWLYVAAMLSLNVSALMIYDLFGRFGPFHFAAIASLVSTILGLASARAARRHRLARARETANLDVARHYAWMSWSYVGLAAAAVAETATRVPAFRPGPGQGAIFGVVVVVTSLAVVIAGGRLIKRRTESSLAPFRAR